MLDRLNLERRGYFLIVSRFEPENHPLEVRRAFEHLDTRLKLALVGDAPHAGEYIREVRNTSDPRIVIPGAVYGLGYRELGSHCFAYIQATEVGGTHPALIEQMGRGALVIYRNTPENAEVCGDAASLSKTKRACSQPCNWRSGYPKRRARNTAPGPASACASVMIGRL